MLALTESPTEGAVVQTTIEHHGAAGNSCTGTTALGIASVDDRVHAVFVLSGSSSTFGADADVINGISVPVGYVVGGSDDIAGANTTADYDLLADGIPCDDREPLLALRRLHAEAAKAAVEVERQTVIG